MAIISYLLTTCTCSWAPNTPVHLQKIMIYPFRHFLLQGEEQIAHVSHVSQARSLAFSCCIFWDAYGKSFAGVKCSMRTHQKPTWKSSNCMMEVHITILRLFIITKMPGFHRWYPESSRHWWTSSLEKHGSSFIFQKKSNGNVFNLLTFLPFVFR